MSARELRKASFHSIRNWLQAGWRTYGQLKGPSIAYASIFAVIGLTQFALAISLGLTPLVVSLAGAFMLVGPVFLCGFLNAAAKSRAGTVPTLSDFLAGFRRAPPGLWVLALVDSLFLMIWLTDAGTMYALYFGSIPHVGLPEFLSLLAGKEMRSFFLFTSIMGAALAFAVFVISAFAVPLIFSRRMGLAAAVGASVRAVFSNFAVMMLWALFLAASIFLTILLFLPAFVVVFPVLAYASEACCREVWPGGL